MTGQTDELRQRLWDLADQATPSASPFEAVQRRTRRLRMKRRLAVAGSGLAALAVALAGGSFAVLNVAGSKWELPAPDGPFLAWPAVGNAVGGPMVSLAWESWDEATKGETHSSRRTLLAHEHAALGPVVVLEALDAQGRTRIAFFAGRGASAAPVLRADRAAPDPASTAVVSLVSPRMEGAAGSVGSRPLSWVVAVGAPGTTSLSVRSTAQDQQTSRGGGAGPGQPFLITSLPADATSINTTVTGWVGSRVGYQAKTDGGALGDVIPVKAAVIGRDGDDWLTVRLPIDARVAVGDLVAVADGLVGEVTQASDGRGTVQLASHAGFETAARTALSDYTGTLSGNGNSLRFKHIPAQGVIATGNRVVVDDPAQHAAVGAITAGRIASDVADTGDFAVQWSVDVDKLAEVFVLIPAERA